MPANNPSIGGKAHTTSEPRTDTPSTDPVKGINLSRERFEQITSKYSSLRVAVIGDFCLDRYLEIDPAKREFSIETGLPVHNVINVRAQPGGAGTILNNLGALGVGELYPVGFAGMDGEGYELRRALGAAQQVRLDHFLSTDQRRTFTYCKPLVTEAGKAPIELNRFDTKNWTFTPAPVEEQLIEAVHRLALVAHALIVLEQVDKEGTGVVTPRVLRALGQVAIQQPALLIIADSRRGLRGYPPLTLKMNASELATLVGPPAATNLAELQRNAVSVAQHHKQNVFVTLAEQGMLGATPDGQVIHIPAMPLRGQIDIVGAGDAVTANLAAALAAGAALREALELATVAASVVIHQVGTTGTATVPEIRNLLFSRP